MDVLLQEFISQWRSGSRDNFLRRRNTSVGNARLATFKKWALIHWFLSNDLTCDEDIARECAMKCMEQGLDNTNILRDEYLDCQHAGKTYVDHLCSSLIQSRPLRERLRTILERNFSLIHWFLHQGLTCDEAIAQECVMNCRALGCTHVNALRDEYLACQRAGESHMNNWFACLIPSPPLREQLRAILEANFGTASPNSNPNRTTGGSTDAEQGLQVRS